MTAMPRFRAVASVAATFAASAILLSLGSCSKTSDGTPSPASTNQAPEPPALTGNERFAWTQSADSVAGYHFSVYADGVKIDMPAAACRPPASGQAECDAPLPPLAAGRHTLEVVSWILKDGTVVESAKSPPITVVIAERKRP